MRAKLQYMIQVGDSLPPVTYKKKSKCSTEILSSFHVVDVQLVAVGVHFVLEGD